MIMFQEVISLRLPIKIRVLQHVLHIRSEIPISLKEILVIMVQRTFLRDINLVFSLLSLQDI